jgi:hypothetical protein
MKHASTITGLFLRTVVVPVSKTLFSGVDRTLRDAEGRMVWVKYKPSGPEEVEVVGRIRKRLIGSASDAQRGTLVLVSVAVALNALGVVWAVGARNPLSYLVPLLIISVLWGLWWRARRRVPVRFRASRVAAEWLAEGCCPACGYKLAAEELRGHSSSVVTCAECGAGWHPR